MKKWTYLLILLAMTGCTQKKYSTIEDVRRVRENYYLSNSQKENLVAILNDRTKGREMRLESFKVLRKNSNTNLRNNIEKLLLDEIDLREEFLIYSLNYSDFKYDEKSHMDILKIYLKDKRFDKFISEYNEEEMEISLELSLEIMEGAKLSSLNFNKYARIVTLANDYNSFVELIKFDPYLSFNYFIDKKKLWVFRVLKEDRKLFVNLTLSLDAETYALYKPVVYHYLNNGDIGIQKIMAELIVENEALLKEKILDQNYFIQTAAIKRYGKNETMAFLAKMRYKTYEYYRAMAFLKVDDIYEEIVNEYQKNRDIKYLVLVYSVGTETSREFFIEQLIRKEPDVKTFVIEEIKKINEMDSFRLVYELLLLDPDVDARINYINLLTDVAENEFVKISMEVLAKDRYTKVEKKLIMGYLGDLLGRETQSRILRTFENKFLKIAEAREAEAESIEEKIIVWNDYLEEFEETQYRELIVGKITELKKMIEDIKNGNVKEAKMKLTKIDQQLALYEAYIQNENSVESTEIIASKKLFLKKEREKLVAEIVKSYKKTLIIEEGFYNGLLKEKSRLENHLIQVKARKKIDEEYVEIVEGDIAENKRLLIDSLTKIKILYEEYLILTDSNEEILSPKTLNKIK